MRREQGATRCGRRVAHLEERPASLCRLHHVGRPRRSWFGRHVGYDSRKERKDREDERGEGGGGRGRTLGDEGRIRSLGRGTRQKIGPRRQQKTRRAVGIWSTSSQLLHFCRVRRLPETGTDDSFSRVWTYACLSGAGGGLRRFECISCRPPLPCIVPRGQCAAVVVLDRRTAAAQRVDCPQRLSLQRAPR